MWRKKRRRLSLCVGLWMCRVTEHNDHVDFFPVRPVYHVYMMEPGQSRGAAGLSLFSNTLFDSRSREKRQRRRSSSSSSCSSLFPTCVQCVVRCWWLVSVLFLWFVLVSGWLWTVANTLNTSRHSCRVSGLVSRPAAATRSPWGDYSSWTATSEPQQNQNQPESEASKDSQSEVE